MQHHNNQIEFSYADLDEAFPPCDSGTEPLGSRVLLQVRTAKKKTKHGIILVQDVQDTEQHNTQVAKIVGLGALAFRNRNTAEPWVEGAWAKMGEFVRIPRYGGDRWHVKTADGEGEALFVIFNDTDLVAKVTGDPLAIKAFL